MDIKTYDTDLTFISYLDFNNKLIEGYFELLESNGWKIVFKTKSNIISIPICRVIKIKEKIK